jgi:DNA replication and repair protein RecF
VQFGHDIARVQGLVEEEDGQSKLEVVVMTPETNEGRFGKKFFINGVTKSRTNYVGKLPLVAFRPEELDIVIAGPHLRRQFLDDVLETVDREYYLASIAYEKALRQRNALLDVVQETGIKNRQQFAYWDELVIRNGSVIHAKRKEFIMYLNEASKDIFPFEVIYDHSIVSSERLAHYEHAEIAAGNTLVGPHRDDFSFLMDVGDEKRDIKTFGSRGQQRLVVLQLKMLQIAYVTEKIGIKPLLVLDDIFSELDSNHIDLVLDQIGDQQVILTTTHKEFLPQASKATVIELNKVTGS